LLYEPLGYLPDIEKILSIGVPVIEDISQSAGSSRGETRAGSFGVFAILGLEERHALTAGGGALLLAAKRRDALALKKNIEGESFSLGKLGIDLLPDINNALALIQLKEFAKNETRRKEIHEAYTAALMQGRHKLFPVESGVERAAYCFSAVLASGFKDVKQYAAKKGIEIEQAFAHSIAGTYPEVCESCVHARSLFLRTALFPLYPRLSKKQAETVCKALATLP
jgi:dTDP-4-amino-4,6-dideoxygalactose transaminase